MNSIISRVRANAAAFFPGKDIIIADESLQKLAATLRASFRPMRTDPGAVTEADILGDLFLGAVNYCYWVGRADYYPAGGGAALINKVVRDLVKGSDRLTNSLVTHMGEQMVRHIAFSGLPLADRRIAHIREITASPGATIQLIEDILAGASADQVLERVLVLYPGFTGDPFLKRAILFVHLLNRVRGLLKHEEVALLPIAADYQIPKYLAHFHVLLYSANLGAAIANGDLIPSGSRMEIEIRAASIVACDRLAEASGLTPGNVDDVLWGSRRLVTSPYHLTVTTDY